MSPQRIQLRRTKGWRKPPSITVARPTKWGNPLPISDYLVGYGGADLDSERRRMAVSDFRGILDGRWPYLAAYPTIDEVRAELRGHDLACWCPLDQPCHADVLLELANQ